MIILLEALFVAMLTLVFEVVVLAITDALHNLYLFLLNKGTTNKREEVE